MSAPIVAPKVDPLKALIVAVSVLALALGVLTLWNTLSFRQPEPFTIYQPSKEAAP